MTNNKVASYAERIERLLDERATIDADIKDIYTEVKAADLKPKVLRKAIANKRRKVDRQFEADVEEYAALLLALPGATYRSVSEQTGVPKSTLQRRVPRKRNGTKPPHDPKTGEIINHQQEDSHETMLSPRSESLPGNLITGADKANSLNSDIAVEANGGKGNGSEVARVAPPVTDARTFDEIAGEMPPGLRRWQV